MKVKMKERSGWLPEKQVLKRIRLCMKLCNQNIQSCSVSKEQRGVLEDK